MKKILLTLLVGFCFGSLAMAQEPAKVAKKKSQKIALLPVKSSTAVSTPATPEEIKAKALEAEKAKTTSAAKASKAVVAEKAN